MRRMGVLIGFAEDDPETKVRLAAILHELEKLGWSEGRNVQIEFASQPPAQIRIRHLAKQLVAIQPDVILAHTAQVADALQRESRTIPIVFVNVSDPIGSGIIASLARPGGNFTGVLQYEASVVGKWLAMLKEISPHLTRVAIVAPKTPLNYFFVLPRPPGHRSGSRWCPIRSRAPPTSSTQSNHSRTYPTAVLFFPPDITTITHRDLIIAMAAQHRLPAIYPFRLVVKGGLMSYGTDQVTMFGQTASYIDRILRRGRSADIPVQAPTKYETTLNLKTAKALDLAVPPGLIVAADEVIE